MRHPWNALDALDASPMDDSPDVRGKRRSVNDVHSTHVVDKEVVEERP